MFHQSSSLRRYAFLLVGLLIFIQPAVGLLIAVNPSTAPQISTSGDLGSVATNSAIEPIVLQAVGGTQPYTWSLVTGGTAGVIPPGLALGADGRITGTPTTTLSARTFTVRVTDAANATVQKAFTITVGTDSPRISSAAMGGARVGEAYSHTFQVLQGKKPYTWSTTSSLPVGLTLNPATGVLSGTPDASTVNATASFRDYSIAMRLTTSGNATNTANFTLTVAKLMEWVTPPNLPVQFAGPNCTVGISVSGGKAPYNFTLQSGSALPPGLSLGNSTGILSGRPSAVGNYTFTINATDAAGSTISRLFAIQLTAYTLTISGPASASGAQYTSATPLQFSAIGGAEPYRYSATNLPPGLTLNATTGLITGNFNGAAGTTNFVVTVTDNKAMTANATCAYTITPGPALKWTIDPALPSGKVPGFYSANLSAATGGWAPYTYSVNASTLPAGLTFNPTTRRISGNATAGGNFSVVLTVRDSATPPNVVNATLANSAMQSIPLYIEPYGMTINGTSSISVNQYSALTATQFTVNGGAAPYTWTTASALPAALTLNATGTNGTAATLAGNATAAPGNYTIGVRVTDKIGQSVTSNVTLTIAALPITWGTQPLLPSGKVASSYTTNLTVSGGRPTYTYALKNGSVLPAGLTLNATTGVISGTPTKESAGDALAGKVILNVSKTGNDTTGNGSSAAPFATIQKGIDSAANGNVVVVGPGTYSGAGNTNLNLRGKQIVVKSSAGADQTILDLGRQKGISADSTETLDTVIDGFTFKNGYVQSGADWGGEAIVCTRNQASLKIKNCVFTLNETKATYVTTSMQIVANRSSSASIPQVENCLFYENTIGGGGWTPYSGGGASVISGVDISNSTIANNTLYSSVSSWGGFVGGIRIAVTGDKIKNSIVWGNSASFYPSTFPAKYQLGAQSDSSTSVAYSISQNGTINNGSATVLNADPKFINAASGDFRLAAGSPAIDAGDPTSTKDTDGSRADMGYRKTADPSNGFTFTIIASDSASPVKNTAEREFTLPIASYGMAVSGPDAASGAQYSSLNATQFTVSGGVAPHRWSATGLPATLSINATTGLVSGNLTAAPGNYTANITVTDNRSQTATKNYTITVSALPMAWSTNATLPAGKVADAYSANLTITSGRPPYTYALSNSTLPAGLALNTATGLLSGTPTLAGNYSFTINASDSAVPKNTISRNFTLTVAPYGMEFTGPTSIVGQQYSTITPAQFTLSGGTAPFTLSATGLPTALSINATSRAIIGMLTAPPGNYTSTITLTDGKSQTATRNLTVTILPAPPVTWLPETLPPMRVGIPFSANLTVSGGRSPYTFSVNASALPTGLTLSAGGVLSGTPTRDGNFTFAISAADSGTPKNSANRTLSVPVLPYGMLVVENPVISGKQFTAITPVQLAVNGGIANYTWSANSTTGLTVNASAGLLSGNLTAAPGNYTLVASVRDGRNQTATRNLTVSILQVDLINWTTNATLPPGKVADNYSANLTVRDGTPPYTFAIKSGSTLPGNLTLNASTGVLRGIPATAGNFTFTLVARDSGNATTERAFTLAVAPYGMAITNEPPITGQMNQAFSYPFTVSGGIAAYTWNATGAPAGLTMNATTGILSGTPTASGNFATSVRVTDGKAQAVSRNYTISIAATAPLSISTSPNLGTIDISKGYTTTLQAVGGKPPYTWTINGTKPASVNLAANGTLTANSSTALTANFTVRVQDSSTPAANATQVMTLTYRNPNQLAIATSSLPQGRANSEYSHQLAATGGATPYLWTITSGTLPAGMVFSPTGWLTGTPTVTANTTLTFEVTDSTTVKSSRQLQLVIGSAAGNATASGKLFTDVTSSVNLPEHYIIAVEDFDNDGREDLLATNAAGSVVLLRNAGAFDFRDITANSGLSDVQPALVADFNNDGVSDILSVNLQRTEATLFLNNGQGVFTKQPLTNLLTGDLANYRDISYADADGDGDLDLLFNINAASGGAVVAVFNQANVSQTTSPLFSGKSYLVKTTWKNAKFSVTDANNDGKPDLVILQTNGAWPTDTHRSNPASLYLNTGNATADYANPTGAKTLAGFTLKPNSGINGGNEMSAFTSFDIDSDGDLDLLNGSSDWPSASVPRIYINDGSGTYTQKDSPILHGSYYHHGATIFDADLDGDQDAVWTSLHVFKDVYPRMWENGATYLKATANGTVDPAKAFYDSTTDWGVDAKISGSGNMGSAGYTADLDGDGDLDFVTNLWSNTTTFKVYRNDANLRQANWLKVELIGAVSPAQGTGARVEVELKDATAKKPAQVTGASRYEMVAGRFTWDEAKADAEKRGGHLAAVGSESEWNLIKPLLSADVVWLGATDEGAPGNWRWVDGTPWTFSNWREGEPNGGAIENWVMVWPTYISSNRTWNDTLPKSFTGVGCSYLLEYDQPNSTTATTKLAQYLGSDIGSATNSSITFGLADKTQAAKVTVHWPSGLKSVLENVDGNRVIQIREADELPLPRPTDEGDVIAWGANPNGETTVPTTLGKAVQIAAGDASSAALLANGTVSVWGTNWAAQRNVPATLGNVVQIAAGNNHYLALTANGSVVAWGWNTTNQTVVPTTIKRAKFIAAGFNSSYAITGDGRIVAWGANDVGQLNVPAGLSGVTTLSAGRGHVLALKSNGTVVAWGRNDLGQATVPAGLTGVIQIAAGDYHSLALKSDGTVVAWGANWITQSTVPAGLGNVVQISAKGDRSLALKADNSVVSWGLNADNIAPPPAPGTMLGISAGSKHSLGLVRKIQIALTGDQPVLKENQPLSDFGFTATGGSGNYTWSVVGAKPDWLTLNATTGLLSGTPTTAGNQTVTIRVSSGGRWSDIALTFEIQKAIPTALWVATTGNNTTGDGSLGKPFATITKAHSVANRGDVIKVLPGNYTESVVIEKSLEISSTAGPAKTTIRSAGLASAVYCKGEGVKGGKLIGFTLTGGGGANNPGNNRYGGGFAINAPAGTTYEVKNCIISDNNNAGITFGGGLHATGGTTLSLTNSLIKNNAAWANGGAALIEGANLIADRCTIVSNTNNAFNRIGGISAAGNCNIQIKNSILWNNTTNQYGSFSSGPGGNATFTFSYSDIQGGTTATIGGNTKTLVVVGPGNINSDPKFAETTYYTLGAGSPAINTGDPNAAKDTDGSHADMGWDFAATSLGADSDDDGVPDSCEEKDGTNPNDSRSFDPLSRGLVAYYPFNGNANDESGNGINATVTGATLATDRSGVGSRAYSFSGANNFVSSPFISFYIHQKTFSAWVYLDPVNQSGGGVVGLQTKGGTVFDSLVYNETSQGWGFGSDNWTRSGWSGVKETAPRWVHVVATYTNNQYRLYQNGSLILTTANFTANVFSNAQVIIGMRHTGGGGSFLRGAIDDVRIYNRALTAAEVTQLYSKESGQPNTVLVQGGTLPAGSALAGQAVAPFQIARFETTWAEWKAVRTWALANGYTFDNNGTGLTDAHPVANVSWYDVVKWCNAKSQMEGFLPVYTLNGTTYKQGQANPTASASSNGYRLPVEKEWEFAARGGVNANNYTYSGGNNIEEVAWYLGNSNSTSAPVGGKKPNEVGIYDMSGNVEEWCWDTGSYGFDKRVKGGNYLDPAERCDFETGHGGGPDYRFGHFGFRYARNATGDMVTIQGGTLPQSSALAGQSVQAFQIGKYEVTWGEWKTVRTWAVANGYTDLATVGNGTADNHPVQMINWYDVVKWSNAKSAMEGLTPVYQISGATYKTGQSLATANSTANGYRLPYRAEWDWAARGGVSGLGYAFSGSNNADLVGWYSTNAGGNTKPIGSKAPNELGLYDMTGNVWEWCSENEGAKAYYAGGSWYNDLDYARLSYVAFDTPESRYDDYGFRLARNIGPKISISGTMPEPTLNQTYAGYTFTAVGATGAPVWSVSSGSLPPGMSFNATTATLSGTPTTAGNYTFTIKVASGGYSDERQVVFDVKKLLLSSVATSFTTTLQPGIWHGFILGPSSENFAYIPKITPKASVTQGGLIDKFVVQPEYDGVKWNDVLRIIASPLNPSFEVDVRVFKIGEFASVPAASALSKVVLHRDFGSIFQPSDWRGFILDETSNKVAYVPKITPRPNATDGAYIERTVVQSEFNGTNWNDVLRIDTADTGYSFEADLRVFKIKPSNELSQGEEIANVSISGQFQTTLQPGVWHGFILGPTSKDVSYIPEITPVSTNAIGGAFVEKYTVQSEFNGTNWYDVLRMVIPLNQASTPVHVRVYKLVAKQYQDMVTVQGGTLPQSSALAGQSVQAFQIGKYEVTWGEWKTIRDWAVANGYTDLANVGAGSGDDHPVQNVNWYDALKWCNAKSEMEGLTPVYQISGTTYKTGQSLATVNSTANGYRLPFRGEWDWAARGGVSSLGYAFSGSNNADLVGWYSTNAGGNTKPIGSKAPNELGLYDMTGNVWEWCSENEGAKAYYSGGSWYNDLDYARLSYTAFDAPTSRYPDYGFRLARNIGPKISISGTMPEPTLNQAYAGYTFSAVGATGAQVWSVSSGSLPLGMSFNATTATLSGIPTTAGNYTFTIKVASGGYSDEVEIDFEIVDNGLVDSDGDGVSNYREIQDGTNPNDPQSVDQLSIGLVAYYPFNGNANDESGNGFNATGSNLSFVQDRNGNATACLALTSSFAASKKIYLSGTANRTFSEWVKVVEFPAKTVAEWGPKPNANIAVFPSSVIIGNNFSADGQWWMDTGDGVAFYNIPVASTWKHLTVVYSGDVSQAKVFLNGTPVLLNNMVLGKKNFDSGDYLPIQFSGASWNTSGLSSLNLIDDVRVYNRALSDAEVSQLYAKESGQPTMVTVQGGTLPQSSALAGQSVQAFQIGKYEVTWGEWKAVRTWAVANGYTDLSNVGAGSGNDHPVRSVNLFDVLKWCNAKSQMEGLVPAYYSNGTIYKTGESIPAPVASANGYRIPNETEWEWAARGGIASQGFTYSGSNTLDDVGWYQDNSQGAALDLGGGRGTWPVGLKSANELGIRDMSGNIVEWANKDNGGLTPTARGGAFAWIMEYSKVSQIFNPDSGVRDDRLGFRLARNIGPKISISGTMPEPTLNQVYAGYTFTAVGTTGAPTWSVSSGSFPPGMSFNATTATLSGTPTTAGNYTFTIKVASGGYSDEVEVDFEIAAPQVNYAEMVLVQGGTLPSGSALANQTVSAFHIAKFETTWGEWQEVRNWAVSNGYNDLAGVGSGSTGNRTIPDNYPVLGVNWHDAIKWCNAKSEREGLAPFYLLNGAIYRSGQGIPSANYAADGYRLPIEAEWEWAARGAVKSQGYIFSGSNNINLAAWYYENSIGSAFAMIISNGVGRGTWPVGQKLQNELGVKDMSGSVLEWCWDISGSNRSVRGGSWASTAESCAVAYRFFSDPNTRGIGYGFRYVRNAIGDMVTVQGGTLPVGSGLAGQVVQTFNIGRFEVTWEEWQSVRTYAIANGYDLTGIGNGTASTHPVQNVNWYDVLKWCNAKSQMEGLTPVYTVNGTVLKTGQNVPNQTTISNGYRLPIEIEWEWAARGGVSSQGYTYSGSNDVNSVMWYNGNSSGVAKPVGTKIPNELGIYDMSGNMWEWCWDLFSTSSRRRRGGTFDDLYTDGAVSHWGYGGFMVNRYSDYGFRLARNQQLVLSVSAIGSSQSRLGDAFNYGLNTTGGVGPYTYQIVSGSLPQGLQLTSDGRIIGTSQAAGAFTITMRVTDSLGNTKLIQITITIDPASSNPSIALGAGIDSGGGLISIGQLNNWSSIGSPMDTTSATAGSARITPGLLRMLLQLQTQ